jgi:hypothetical protein
MNVGPHGIYSYYLALKGYLMGGITIFAELEIPDR